MCEEYETDTATEEEVAAMPSSEVTDVEDIPDQTPESEVAEDGDR